MNIKELYESYPLSMGKYEAMFPIMSGIEGEGRRTMTQAFLLSNPRSLYDMFDKEDIIIIVSHSEIGRDFGYNIVDIGGDHCKQYKTRGETEKEAFIKAFEVLETKLKSKTNGEI